MAKYRPGAGNCLTRRKAGGQPKTPGSGRKPRTPNKYPAALKDMILGALSDVGGRDWLAKQANENPVAFMGLIAKVLPMTVVGAADAPIQIEIKRLVVDKGNTYEHGEYNDTDGESVSSATEEC